MKEIRLPLEKFDLKALLKRTTRFLKDQVSPEVDPTYPIVWIQSLEDVPVFGPESGWDVLSALADEGKRVFFPFAFTDVDGTLTCADGNTYGPAPDDEDSVDEVIIGIEDSVGFLVQVSEGYVTLNSAVHGGGGCTGPAPGVDLYPNCGVLEEPMNDFIGVFLKD
jgi:hypothetical protein